MVVLGLLLIGAASAATIGIVAWHQDPVTLTVFGHSLQAHEAGVVFGAGAIAGIVFTIGLMMLLSGLGRGRTRRKERRRIEKRRTAEQRALRERNAELERRLAAEHAAAEHDERAVGTAAPGAGER